MTHSPISGVTGKGLGGAWLVWGAGAALAGVAAVAPTGVTPWGNKEGAAVGENPGCWETASPLPDSAARASPMGNSSNLRILRSSLDGSRPFRDCGRMPHNKTRGGCPDQSAPHENQR